MNCLVTGGCGFVGSHLVEALVGAGHRVRVLDNLSTGRLENLAACADGIELIRGDIRLPEDVSRACRDTEVVFHEAALVSVQASVEQPRENHDINITGLLNVLEAARTNRVRRVIFASSAAVYGNEGPLPKREDHPTIPASPYGMAKLTGEHYLRLYAALYGMETVSLRYFNIFGPRQDPRSMYSGVISRFVSVVQAGGDPTVFGDGRQTRDFVFVKDVVAANLKAMTTAPGAGEAINVATGRQTSLLNLLESLRALTGRDFRWNLAAARPGDIRDSVADIALARRLLGYEPAYDLRTGLQALM